MGGHMNYEQWRNVQLSTPYIKPRHYRVAERIALSVFLKDIRPNEFILDVGCGSGAGLLYMRQQGYTAVGLEIDERKIKVATRLGVKVYHEDILTFFHDGLFDVAYCSHAFEHMFDPGAALNRLMKLAPKLIFILPYVDKNPALAHSAAAEIGTNVDDEGETVNKWFTGRGLTLVDKRFDSYREPEIWLRYEL